MMITIGLCVSNALTALSGGLLAQYQKSCDINLGTGMVTIALASLIIGETLIGKGSMLKRVTGVILGSCLYRFIVAIALRLNVPAECLKLVSALIVAIAIAFPYLKSQFAFGKQRRATKLQNEQYLKNLIVGGGDDEE
jgi:putative ABC transport system permease protein